MALTLPMYARARRCHTKPEAEALAPIQAFKAVFVPAIVVEGATFPNARLTIDPSPR